jgi:hypothetical protein
MLSSVTSSAVHILEYSFLIILQENIDTVKVESVENAEAEDCIEIKTEEEFCIQLMQTVKAEEEVSVVCWCVLWG